MHLFLHFLPDFSILNLQGFKNLEGLGSKKFGIATYF